MKITGITVWQVDLPLQEGSYRISGGDSLVKFDTTVVCVDTDEELKGYGEVCPLGGFYFPAFAKGIRTGIQEIGPSLLGMDPTQIGKINEQMDEVLKGHPFVKSAVDMACWDILGKKAGQPLSTLFGGTYGEDAILHKNVSLDEPETMAKRVARYKNEGYKRFSLQVGGEPDQDIDRIQWAIAQLEPGDKLVADANSGWLKHEAMKVVRAVRDLDILIEQPCQSYEECLSIRQNTENAFVLDEVIERIPQLLRAHNNLAMDVLNIKISKYGGLTKAKLVRDLCMSLGIAVIIEDSWGGDITTAAIAHLAQSTPPQFLFACTDFNSYGTKSIATGAPKGVNGGLTASKHPGLGIDPIPAVLGEPEFEIKAP